MLRSLGDFDQQTAGQEDMYTTVNLGRVDSGSISEVSRLFGEFDKSGMNQLFGVRYRQLFNLGDLLIHTQDFDEEIDESMVPAISPEGTYSPFDAQATRFYAWQAKRAVASAALFSTVIVGRMSAAITAKVRAIFEELDSTDVPDKMGTRSRQLYICHDVYVHVQHFTGAGGKKQIDQAWRDADPRFIKACNELMAIIPPYDPATWAVPTDSLATCFYKWGEMP